jgi:hypothetical protein
MPGCFVFTSPPNPDGGAPNYRPVICADLTKPAFGPVGPLGRGDLVEFDVCAEDPNIEDGSLTARIYKQVSGAANDLGVSTQLAWTGIEFSLDLPALPDKDNPTRRLGTSPALACAVWGAPSATTNVFIIVADRPFSKTQPDQVIPGGLSDQKYWELQCL